jgi:hypothetical protein
MSPTRPRLLPAWLLAMLVLFGCDAKEDSVIGASCTQSSQCRFKCATGGAFPGGFCTIPCQNDTECPKGAVCIDRAGGVCLFLCNLSTDCSFLGAGWACGSREHLPSGREKVCIGD